MLDINPANAITIGIISIGAIVIFNMALSAMGVAVPAIGRG
jgi:hypothetical protein